MTARTDTAKVEVARARTTLAGLVRRGGVGGASRTLGGLLLAHARYPVTARRRARERFELLGHELPYTLTRYNSSFRNERREVSVARWFLNQGAVGRMLEVGNVLGHYGIEGHDVLDRYETIRGVINEDIVEFAPVEPYDTIVSISTLEHVGWDETSRVPERSIAAFDNLEALTNQQGRILVTIPIGYNARLDAAIESRRVSMPVQTMLRRTDGDNHWVETSFEEGLKCRYDTPFNNANAVYVGMRHGRPSGTTA